MLKAFTFSGFRPSLDRCVVRLLFFYLLNRLRRSELGILEKKDDPMRGGMRGVIRMERLGCCLLALDSVDNVAGGYVAQRGGMA